MKRLKTFHVSSRVLDDYSIELEAWAGHSEVGAGEGNRTLDTQLGKLMFCH